MSRPPTAEDPIQILVRQFQDIDFAPTPFIAGRADAGEDVFVRVPAERLIEVMQFLRNDPRTRFNMLAELNGIDYLNFPKARDRFAVTYGLLSIPHNQRIWVKCFVNDPEPAVPSVCSIWRGAEWLEREVYDMFGVRFTGHPDLRRILTWEGFGSNPLRKDYPLRGRGERENYPVVSRDSA